NYYKDIGDHCANIAKLFYYAYVHMNSAKSGLETKYFLRSLAFFYSIFCQSPLSSTIEASKNLEVSLMKILDLHSDPQCLTQIINLLSLMGLNKEYIFDCEIDFVSYAQNYDFISLPKNFSELCWKACNINCPKTGFKTNKVLCLFCGNYICYRGICCIGPKFKDWENDCFSHHAKNKDILAL
ncbi:MAG: E3 ubiquitin-protein ligase ubr1, partial [Paramarteilia canceri]